MATTNEIIKLIIRTANNKYSDFHIEISPLLTVYDLKQNITLNHPTKPIPKDQRLIFSGKLLEDTNILNQVFNKSTSGSSFMLHLVLDADKRATTRKTPPPAIIKPTVIPERLSSPVTPPATSHSASYEQYMQELTNYQQQLQQFVSNPNGLPPTPNYETQAYLQYCYTHHQMYQNYLAYQRTTATSITSTPIVSTATSQSQAPAAAVAAAAAAPPAPAANNNEFDQENDLLGTLHIVVELFVLCSIIYFYSTFNRFLIVFVIFALLYLHCRGFLSMQRRRRVVQAPAPAPAAPAVVVEQPADNDGEQVVDEETDVEQVQNEDPNSNDLQRQQSSTPGPATDNQITPGRLVITAVSTFFSSLIPERPQRI